MTEQPEIVTDLLIKPKPILDPTKTIQQPIITAATEITTTIAKLLASEKQTQINAIQEFLEQTDRISDLFNAINDIRAELKAKGDNLKLEREVLQKVSKALDQV